MKFSQIIHRLARDARFAQAMQNDPENTLAQYEHGLSPSEKRALLAMLANSQDQGKKKNTEYEDWYRNPMPDNPLRIDSPGTDYEDWYRSPFPKPDPAP